MRNLLSKLLPLVVSAGIAASPALAADVPKAAPQNQKAEASKAAPQPAPAPMFAFPTVPKKDIEPNTLSESVTPEAKKKAIQSIMLVNPLALRDMINLMVYKKKAKPGLTFDDVVESLKLRANFRNFKFVGHQPMSKDVEAVTGKPSPRVEVFSFCDSVVARHILDYSPEMIAFLPCRVAVLEDAHKAIWVLTIDWDITWLDTSQNPNKIPDQMREASVRIHDTLVDMIDAAANGDL